MRKLAVGSLVTLILCTGLIASQVDAKTNKNDEKGKNKQVVSKVLAKAGKHNGKEKNKYDSQNGKEKNKYNNQNGKEKNKPEHQVVAKTYTNGNTRSVPIPGSLLLMGGGLVGLVAWRARQRNLSA